MPTLPPRLCAGGCGSLVVKGRCPRCSQSTSKRRETSTARGYGAAWRRFRVWFVQAIVDLGVSPVCGARHPDAPATQDSQCRIAGLFTYRSLDGSDLHLDHDPPLEEWERIHDDLVCDASRVQLLCAECHARKDDPGRRGIH